MDKNKKKTHFRAFVTFGQLLIFLTVLLVFFFALQRIPESLLQASRGLSATLTKENNEAVNLGGKDIKTPNGLSLEILKIGLQEFDGNKNIFSEQNTFLPGKRNAVVFEVKNQGQDESGLWKFEARLPTKKEDFFYSPIQTSLKPGNKIRFILGFENIDPKKQNDFSVKIHPL